MESETVRPGQLWADHRRDTLREAFRVVSVRKGAAELQPVRLDYARFEWVNAGSRAWTPLTDFRARESRKEYRLLEDAPDAE